MNERKKSVLEAAHTLFVEKGYAATSVQDILTASGISKGTFYNYFTSKNELLISIFEKITEEINEKRQRLIAGRPVHDKQVLIEQIRTKMEVNKENNLFILFQGVFVSDDEELKQVIKEQYVNELRWMQRRILEIYGKKAESFSVDLALMLFAIVHHAVHFSVVLEEPKNLTEVIAYAMRRVETAIEPVVTSKDQLFDPLLLEQGEVEANRALEQKRSQLLQKIGFLQQSATEEQAELLRFLQDEIREKQPRRYLTEAAASRFPEQAELLPLIKTFFYESAKVLQ